MKLTGTFVPMCMCFGMHGKVVVHISIWMFLSWLEWHPSLAHKTISILVFLWLNKKDYLPLHQMSSYLNYCFTKSRTDLCGFEEAHERAWKRDDSIGCPHCRCTAWRWKCGWDFKRHVPTFKLSLQIMEDFWVIFLQQ